jgi:hypothetical protein
MQYALIRDFGSGLPLLLWAKQDINQRMPIILSDNLIAYAQILNVPFITNLPTIADIDLLVVGKTPKLGDYLEFILSVQKRRIEWNIFLDSWVDYKVNESLKPNSVWVTDSWAFELARSIYKYEQICVTENYLLSHVKKKCLPRNPSYLLYVASPPNHYSGRSIEMHGKECICQDINRIRHSVPNNKICIRFHPGYHRSPCEVQFLRENLGNTSDFHFSESIDFTQDLQNAEIVFGPISYLHYLAESIQIPSFSTSKPNPNWNGPQFRLI